MASTLPPPPPMETKPDKTTEVPQSSHEEDTGSEKDSNGVHIPDPDDPTTPLEDDPAEWDFTLPRIPASETLDSNDGPGNKNVSFTELVGAIQGGKDCATVRKYLTFVDQTRINDHVSGFPAMFYIVERRDPSLIRLWVKHGGDVNAKATSELSKDVPLLAFAVVLGDTFKTDTTDVVATLLGLGASPGALPEAFYHPLERDLPQEMPELAQQPETMSWCTASARALLATRLNYRQRYYMHMASLLKPNGVRAKQVTRYKNAEALLAIPYLFIGQTPAAQFFIKKLLQHLVKPPKTPLVMIFAGPSGHGKTELARKLGELISL